MSQSSASAFVADILNAVRAGNETAHEIARALGMDSPSYRLYDWLGYLEYDRALSSFDDDHTVKHYRLRAGQ